MLNNQKSLIYGIVAGLVLLFGFIAMVATVSVPSEEEVSAASTNIEPYDAGILQNAQVLALQKRLNNRDLPISLNDHTPKSNPFAKME